MRPLLAAILLLSSSLGSAQSASQLFDQGLAALKEQRYRDAAEALDASYRLEQVAKTMYHLGLAYEGLGYPSKAVEALTSYVSYANPKTEKATVEAAQGRIDRIKSSVAQFAVSLDPTDASLVLDGSPAKIENGELWLQPGPHRISITAPDHDPFEQTIEVKPGRFELDIHLRAASGPPEVRAARLLDEGDQLKAVGDIHGAVIKYDAAQAVLPTPRGAGSAGLAKEQVGAVAEAEAGVLEALQSPRDPWVRKHRAELKKARARLAKVLATLVIVGDSEFAGATISIDERVVGRLPLPSNGNTRTKTGVIHVKATLSGYDDFLYELEVRPRSLSQIRVTMNKSAAVAAPVPIVAAAAPPPEPAAPPVAAATPALSEEPPAPEPVPERPKEPERDMEAARQADIEQMVERYEPDASEDDGEPATGMEMAMNVGYQFNWRGLAGSSGSFATHLFSIGVRPLWPISFGVQLVNASVDAWNDDTRAVVAINPGFYLRGHTQQTRKAMAFDVWGGVGLQPLSMGLAVYKSQDSSSLNASTLDEAEVGDVVGQVAKSKLGVGDAVTQQWLGVPLELGLSFYLTKGLALELSTAFTFWLPSQQCYWDQNDRVCYDDDLETQKSLYIGVGLGFLP